MNIYQLAKNDIGVQLELKYIQAAIKSGEIEVLKANRDTLIGYTRALFYHGITDRLHEVEIINLYYNVWLKEASKNR